MALIARIHREAGVPVAVRELSAAQLAEAVDFAPEGAVLLGLEDDAALREARLRIFALQGNDDVAVAPLGLGVEDLGGCARRVCFGDGPQAELSARAGHLWWDEEPLLDVEELGAHELRVAMAAAALCLARGIEPDAVRAGLRG